MKAAVGIFYSVRKRRNRGAAGGGGGQQGGRRAGDINVVKFTVSQLISSAMESTVTHARQRGKVVTLV